MKLHTKSDIAEGGLYVKLFARFVNKKHASTNAITAVHAFFRAIRQH